MLAFFFSGTRQDHILEYTCSVSTAANRLQLATNSEFIGIRKRGKESKIGMHCVHVGSASAGRFSESVKTLHS